MNTTTTDPARVALSCPPWCVLPVERHRAEWFEGAICVDHSGPSFGPVVITSETRDSELQPVLGLWVGHEPDQLTGAELRALAADALAAAEWLEGQR